MKPKEVPTLIVDIHESDSGLFEKIKERNIGDCSVQSLKIGDVKISFMGIKVICERKAGSDFDESLKSKRLHAQIYRMADEYKHCHLIVESWKPYILDDPTTEQLENRVSKHKKIIRRFNEMIITDETRNIEETIDLIEGIIEHIRLGKYGVINRQPILIATDIPAIALLSSLPHVGVQTATEILEAYRTPAIAFENMASWIEIPGITEARLAVIMDIWSKEMER